MPAAVQEEVSRKKRFRYTLKKLYRTDFFKRCRVANAVDVQLLTVNPHEGEAEALVQARGKRAAFFIGDDRKARKIGENLGLKPIGTAQLVARLHIEGLAGDPRALIHKLQRDLGYRIAEHIIEQAIDLAAEPI